MGTRWGKTHFFLPEPTRTASLSRYEEEGGILFDQSMMRTFSWWRKRGHPSPSSGYEGEVFSRYPLMEWRVSRKESLYPIFICHSRYICISIYIFLFDYPLLVVSFFFILKRTIYLFLIIVIICPYMHIYSPIYLLTDMREWRERDLYKGMMDEVNPCRGYLYPRGEKHGVGKEGGGEEKRPVFDLWRVFGLMVEIRNLNIEERKNIDEMEIVDRM